MTPDISPQPSTTSRRSLGRVTAVNGAQATLAIEAGVSTTGESAQITVGRFMGIATNRSTVIGLITEVSEQQTNPQPALYRSIARLDLIGEILKSGADTTALHARRAGGGRGRDDRRQRGAY